MTDSTAVISGAVIFRLVDTHGIPLGVLDYALQRMGLGYDMAGFVRAALGAGWGLKTIRGRLHELVVDSGLTPSDRDFALEKIDVLLGVRVKRDS